MNRVYFFHLTERKIKKRNRKTRLGFARDKEPERDSSCDTMRTSFDFMKFRGLEAAFPTWTDERTRLSCATVKRLMLQESELVALIKSTVTVETDKNAAKIIGQRFFAIAT